MGSLRTAALVILSISALVFIALFGRLPAFRKTPIAFLHRALWVHIPNGVAFIDSLLLGGRVMRLLDWIGSYVLNENHPLVLIFFVALQAVGQCVFLPVAWPRLSSTHQFWAVWAVIMPYILLYKCVVTTSFITPENHEEEMKRYPYDRVLFHPEHSCRTCHFLKPARSKHCSFCRACVSRHDHHCVWLMNCVGVHNYRYFLSLLLALTVMLVYGSFLAYFLLCQTRDQLVPTNMRGAMQNWATYFNVWGVVIVTDGRIGTIFLLMLMTAPLSGAFLVYHTYIIWAGMTTNESSKWSEWKEDVEDGFIFKAQRSQIYKGSRQIYEDYQTDPYDDPRWPVQSDQILVIDDEPPREGYMLSPTSNRIRQGDQPAPIDPRWTRLHSMTDVDNIYDMGFWLNLRDALGLSVRRR